MTTTKKVYTLTRGMKNFAVPCTDIKKFSKTPYTPYTGLFKNTLHTLHTLHRTSLKGESNWRAVFLNLRISGRIVIDDTLKKAIDATTKQYSAKT